MSPLWRIMHGFITVGITGVMVIATSRVDGAAPTSVVADWERQDSVATVGYQQAYANTVAKLSAESKRRLQPILDNLDDSFHGGDAKYKQAYIEAHRALRRQRLAPYLDRIRTIVFAKNYGLLSNYSGSLPFNTCGLSFEGLKEWGPGAELCLLKINEDLFGGETVLLKDPDGCIRDPKVSFDGKRILFAWKKSPHDDDYHLYEMEVATVNPTLLPNGQVIYTRWEYNDRNHMYNMALFMMNPDGSKQTEYYGNSSWWPVCVLQARGIPGTSKVMAVLCGHHSSASGKLAIVDPSKGRNYPLGGKASEHGVQLICPVREYVYSESNLHEGDRWGRVGEQHQYPYPLDEKAMLVAYRPSSSRPHYDGPPYPVRFDIFFATIDGDRKLLVSDEKLHCTQPYPLLPHPRAPVVASKVDYREEIGSFYVHDVYGGEGLVGVPRGTVKRLRVVALDYVAGRVGRHMGMGDTTHGVPAPTAGSFMATPISRNWGAWDVKIVLGETPVYEDGSAAFSVPARRPLYFQAIDAKGHCVQTMRSWSTLVPGETQFCVGCHENKNQSPPASAMPTIALRKGARPLEPFHGIENQGFSYPKFVQPILDKHCVRCHDEEHPRAINLKEAPLVQDEDARKEWNQSYEILTSKGLVSWISASSATNVLPPYIDGSCNRKLIRALESGHNNTSITNEEIEILSCWIDLLIPHCGTHTERMVGDDNVAEYTSFLSRRRNWEAQERRLIEAVIRDEYGDKRRETDAE